MANDSHIIFAYELNKKGGSKAVSEKNLPAKVKSNSLTWAHFHSDHPETKKWLEKNVSYLDPLIIEALIADGSRPRMEEFGDGMLIILRGVNLNKNEEPEDMVSIRIWIDDKRIISMRRRKVRAMLDIEDRLNKGKGPKTAGEFLSQLTTRLFERMEPALTELDSNLDGVEEKVIERTDISLRSEIVDIRKQAIMFRRWMAPQKEVIGKLRTSEIKWIDKNHRRILLENYDRVTRYLEDLDAIRERAQIVKDELANALTDKLNRNMYLLSVIAAIFLPLGFLTGLLGINVGGIPGSENTDAFYIFSAILCGVVLLQILVFKKLKWF